MAQNRLGTNSPRTKESSLGLYRISTENQNPIVNVTFSLSLIFTPNRQIVPLQILVFGSSYPNFDTVWSATFCLWYWALVFFVLGFWTKPLQKRIVWRTLLARKKEKKKIQIWAKFQSCNCERLERKKPPGFYGKFYWICNAIYGFSTKISDVYVIINRRGWKHWVTHWRSVCHWRHWRSKLGSNRHGAWLNFLRALYMLYLNKTKFIW